MQENIFLILSRCCSSLGTRRHLTLHQAFCSSLRPKLWMLIWESVRQGRKKAKSCLNILHQFDSWWQVILLSSLFSIYNPFHIFKVAADTMQLRTVLVLLKRGFQRFVHCMNKTPDLSVVESIPVPAYGTACHFVHHSSTAGDDSKRILQRAHWHSVVFFQSIINGGTQVFCWWYRRAINEHNCLVANSHLWCTT